MATGSPPSGTWPAAEKSRLLISFEATENVSVMEEAWWREMESRRYLWWNCTQGITMTKSSSDIALIFIPSQCPAHLETWRWAHVHLSPNVERPIKHYTLIVHIIHKREVINHLRYVLTPIRSVSHFRHFLQMQSSQCHFILHCLLSPALRAHVLLQIWLSPQRQTSWWTYCLQCGAKFQIQDQGRQNSFHTVNDVYESG